ncbi:MAG: DinB family protein [Trueperaceae bacterium]
MSPYIQRIIDYLGNQDPITVLQQTPSKLEDLLETLNSADFDESYEEGKWTTREILAHMADVELMMGYRLRQAVAETNHTLQVMEQDLWAKRYKRLEPSLAVETFRALRGWNLALFSTFGLEDWNKEVEHPERGKETVDLMVSFLAGHDLNHLQQLEKIGGRR